MVERASASGLTPVAYRTPQAATTARRTSPDDEEPYGLTREQIDEAYRAAGLVDVVVETGFEQAYEGMTMAPLLGAGRRAS